MFANHVSRNEQRNCSQKIIETSHTVLPIIEYMGVQTHLVQIDVDVPQSVKSCLSRREVGKNGKAAEQDKVARSIQTQPNPGHRGEASPSRYSWPRKARRAVCQPASYLMQCPLQSNQLPWLDVWTLETQKYMGAVFKLYKV